MEALRKAFSDPRSAALTLGVGTVAVTHAAMVLGFGDEWDEEMVRKHALINLAAAAAVVYGARLV